MGSPVDHPATRPPSTDGPSGASAPPITHCVLWHARDVAPPPALLTNLASKNLRITAATDPYEAMARVAQLERMNDALAANVENTSVPVRDAVIFLMIGPETLRWAADVVQAVWRFAPRTACWQFDIRANPVLRPVVDEDVTGWSSANNSGRSAITRPSSEELRQTTAPTASRMCTPAPESGHVTEFGASDIHVRTRTVDGAKNTR